MSNLAEWVLALLYGGFGWGSVALMERKNTRPRYVALFVVWITIGAMVLDKYLG